MEAVTISEGQKHLFELRDRVVSDPDSVILTHKKGNVVLISMDEWNQYQETQRLLQDKETLRALFQSFEDHWEPHPSKGKSLEEFFSDL